MINYTLRRLAASIPVIFGVLLVTFALARLIPGDPCRAILGERATQEVCDRFIHDKGLDQPIVVQLGIYLVDILTGDFGTSIKFGRPVMLLIVERLPMTIELSVAALVIALLVGIPAGIISARKHNSLIDVGTMVGANIGVSMPVFWLGLMLAYLFAIVLIDTPLQLPPSGRLSAHLSATPFYEIYGWRPSESSVTFHFLEFFSNFYIFNAIITFDGEVFLDAITHLILPSLALSTIPMSIIARITRSSLLEVLGQDYVRTAKAKGLRERHVVLKHALRNALLPVVTVIGLQLGGLLAGAILTETIFGLAGVGRTLFEAIGSRDYPIIQAFTAVIAIVYIMVNLIVDLSYGFLDPRIRIE